MEGAKGTTTESTEATTTATTPDRRFTRRQERTGRARP
jgi:hypothetical protein